MDCDFSNPKDYQGNAPTTDLTSFQFTTAHCNITQFATPSAQTNQATTSSIVRFDDQTNYGFSSIFWVLFFIALLFVILQGQRIGLWIFHKQ
jgi:hypothetical protein